MATKRLSSPVPSFDELLVPTVKALQILGGSGTINEIYQKVIEILRLNDRTLDVQHTDTGQTEVEYRLAWSRTYLKKYGLIENSTRGVWNLKDHVNLKDVDPKEIVRFVHSLSKSNKKSLSQPAKDPSDIEDTDSNWMAIMHKTLLSLSPTAFERLIKRMLRESGFIQVEVTKQSGDGGIDGVGIVRIGGFLSFHMLFQCKRYQGSVTASQIRDFRGAMQGRTEKGLFVTTGTFTSEAMKEAKRDGAPPIDLIDGEELVRQLKELGLGVKIQMVESVVVDTEWFSRI